MEAVEEPPLHNPPIEGLKVSVVSDESDGNVVSSVEMDVCHKSNGVAESSISQEPPTSEPKTDVEELKIESEVPETQTEEGKNDTEVAENDIKNANVESAGPSTSEPDTILAPTVDSSTKIENIAEDDKSSMATENTSKDEALQIEENFVCPDNVNEGEAIIEVEHVVESTVDGVTFQTEILVESNDNEFIETVCHDAKIDGQDTHNILSELGENIVLSEALRSSDVTDNIENNNCSSKQEVFNKEELLDILEGNNEEQSEEAVDKHFQSMPSNKILEAKLAIQQLKRLKSKSRLNKKTKTQNVEHFSRKKVDRKVVKKVTSTSGMKDESIVNTLVKEWDDEEGAEIEKPKPLEEGEKLLKTEDELVNLQESATTCHDESVRTSTDSQGADGKTPAANKSGDEGQPQRRLGRVIKKKVIFDPDNPDTFTKTKIMVKKESSQEKDQNVSKNVKMEQAVSRSESKSPLRKLQWKKPSPKNSKHNKRLTEIDKLLMDEGAVNMIYQLTPEAPKGKKNMKTKAEFIKKIQSSSTPDTKEMKFRERKKESKFEESEARRILGGKQRPSLNSSVKSPSVSEDFEAHSADDSIIYRRHSSSSYSSSCMSPRRLSDVEISGQSTARTTQQMVEELPKTNIEVTSGRPTVDMFMSDNMDVVKAETINRDDCMSIKEKLNTKLNLALNKRKRENSKAEKPPKAKKVMKDKNYIEIEEYKYLTIRFEGRVAVIRVQKQESLVDLVMLKELANALKLIESKQDISVTLFSPECGITCSELHLRSLLNDNVEIRTNYAYVLAETIRSLLQTVEQHTKLLCSAVSGKCTGIGLAIIGLSDVVLASERASFAITAKTNAVAPVEPGVSVLTTYSNLPQSMVTDLVVFGRRLTASEALQSGLVSRTLWPEKFNEQVLTIAKDIAAEPAHNIWLKKQMLRLKKTESESTFLKLLEKERDLFVEYWSSVEGQELLRATYNVA